MEKTETATQNENAKTPEEPIKPAEPKTPTSPMSTSTGSSLFSSWGGWISQAKEKSASVLQAVKSDLEEITSAVSESFNIASTEEENADFDNPQVSDKPDKENDTASNTVSYMKQSLSSFFGSVTDALIPQIDEEDTSEAILITSDDTIVLSGLALHLAKLQNDDETYLEEPSKNSELAEKYRMWLEIVEQDQFTQQKVDKLLQTSEILNEKYNKFVPDTVSHMNFFKRYLFKKALLEDDLANEERRKREIVIEKQPETVIIEPKVVESKLPSTSLNDLELTNYEISEEEQSKLLEEYEKEIKERQMTTDGPEDLVQSIPTEASNLKTAQPSNNPKGQGKSSANVQSRGKNNKTIKSKQPEKSTQQQGTKKGIEKKGKSANEPMKLEKDHFKKENDSTTSDESWEKDFEM